MTNQKFKQLENIVIEIESNSRVRMMVDNEERLKGYHEIGRLLVEAQGGASRAKYGDNLIKEWGEKLAQEYGKNYDESNLKRFRLFYLIFPKSDAVRHLLTWTHIRTLYLSKMRTKETIILIKLYLIIYQVES